MKMKSLLITSLISIGCVSASFAGKLTSYEQLTKALTSGDSVKFVFDASHCQKVSGSRIEKTRDMNMVGGGDFHVYNIYPITVGDKVKNGAATSNTILVNHSTLGPIYNYVRLRVFEDNSAELYSAFYSPTTFKTLGDKSYTCQVDSDKSAGGISLIDVGK